ncbi:retrovirus-related pol polyprotein from transposon RE1 [Citrus sinensis]|nr:retrovirus-related pol polyprotein from transposon RE1 [Citrus sinensis]
MITRSKAGIFKPKSYLADLLAKPSEPTSITQAISNPKWFKAMQEEYQALKNNDTWDLVSPSAPVKVIGSKWVFRIKHNSDGTISRYKARLVAKGFHQTHVEYYTETFSPVVKASTVRIVLSLTVMNKWILRQVDVNNAFLNGILVEDVYMAQPAGFTDSTRPTHVCKLKKAIYGLKQAPRAWFDRFKSAMVSQWRFLNSKSDSPLFYKWENGHILLVLVYVDDIIVTGSSYQLVQQMILNMQKTFTLKDLGELNYFLGIEVSKTSNGFYLSQAKYIADLLAKHNMADCSPVPTPMSTGHQLRKGSGSTITNASHQYLSSPTLEHWEACKRLLRYLKGSIQFGLYFYQFGTLQMNCFSDSDWACDNDDRKSVAGYAVYIGSNLVSWCSKKQLVVSRSSTEAEYRALAQATSEAVWIQALLDELKIKLAATPIMWCDNQGAIALAYNPVYHAKTKHVELDIHFIREKVAAKKIVVQFVPSEDQTADILTKPLTFDQFHYLRSKLNVHPGKFSSRGDVTEHG